MTKIISKLLLFIMIFSLTGCSLSEEAGHFNNNDDDDQDQTYKSDLKIGFCDEETFDPFTSSYKINRAIISLCFDNIIRFDQNYKPYSDYVDYKYENTTATITVKDGYTFSDGNAITINDLKYSLDLASKKNSIFYNRFSYIKKYYIKSNSLVVEFNSINESNLLLLSIPFVKSGSTSNNYIGSGLYFFSIEDGNKYLRKNDLNPFNKECISRILLVDISDKEDLTYNINYSLIDCAYTDYTTTTSNLANNVDSFLFSTLKLYYISLNKSKSYLSSSEVSKAISLATNREEFEQRTSGIVKAVWQPFINTWFRIPDNSVKSSIYSIKDSLEILQKEGFSINKGKLYWKKSAVSLNIICNSDDSIKVEIADMISSSLENIGFSTTISYYSKDNIIKVLEKGDFDIYIGECNIPYNFDISFLVTSDSSISNHINNNDKTLFLESVNSFLSGDTDISDFIDVFNSTQPFIPLFYKNNAVIVDRRVYGDFTPTIEFPYSGITTWKLDY